jgi:Type IV secretion system pilin
MYQPIKNFLHFTLGLFFIVALAGVLLSSISGYAQAKTTTTPAPTTGQQLDTGSTAQTPEEKDSTTSTNGGSGDGLDAFQILSYGCIFKVAGCENALLDDLINILINLAPVVATLVIIWGGYQYFLGGIDGKKTGRNAIEAAIIGLALVLSADYIIGTLVPSIFNGGGISSGGIEDLLGQVKNALVTLASAVAVLVIIWGGYKYLFSGLGGKEDGRKTIENGIIGLVVIFVADQITKLIDELITPNADGAFAFQTGSITGFIVAVVNNLLIPIATALTVFFIVIAGYKWIFTDSLTKAGEAKKALLNAVIGFVIILLAVFIVQLIYLYTPYATTT